MTLFIFAMFDILTLRSTRRENMAELLMVIFVWRLDQTEPLM